ncbi:MAG: hypothetical protein FJZ01_15515 [Candidatus Sericytochromatia bacterium]|nr:hypothetical protein [Candidatus Tanganyikabacteria bacterium]
MPEIKGGNSYADELAQYQRLQQKFTGGDRAKADADDLEAFKKLQERMAAGGVTSDSKAGKIEGAGNNATIPLEPQKPAEQPKTEAPAAPAQPKKKKKNCLQKIGDALTKVAGVVGKFVPVVAQVMDAFKAFKALGEGKEKDKAGDAVINAAKNVQKAADNGDAQSKLLVDTFKGLDKKDDAGTKPPPGTISV